MIERRREWREIALQRWSQANWAGRNILSRRSVAITDATVENLHALADLLITTTADFKLVTSANTAWVYSNNQALLKRLDRLDFLTNKTVSQAVVSRPKNTIKLKNPKHQQRSYFQRVKLTLIEKDYLINFFLSQQDNIRISPALTEFFGSAFLRTQDYFFIDYNEESWLLMLALIRPGLIRKTQSIIQG
jgi:hypothetical protein